jgi:hypothetical protein
MERSMELFSGPIRVHALFFADAEGKDYEKTATAIKDAALKFRTQVRVWLGCDFGPCWMCPWVD